MENFICNSGDVVLVVENLPQSVNNHHLRSIFGPFGAKKCRVVYRKTQFMGKDSQKSSLANFNHKASQALHSRLLKKLKEL